MGSCVHGQRPRALPSTHRICGQSEDGEIDHSISSSLNVTGDLADITKWCALRATDRRVLWPGEWEEAWVELRT